MKVLMTTYTTGMMWHYVMNLCKSLERYQVEIHLLSLGKILSEEQIKQMNLLRNVHLYESSFAVDWEQSAEEENSVAKQWVESIYAEIKPEIIHFNNYVQTGGNWECPVIMAYHFCVLTWWNAVRGTDFPLSFSKYIKAMKEAISASDIIVAPSQSMLHQAQLANVTFKQTQVIHYGLEQSAKHEVEKEFMILTTGCFNNEAANCKLIADIAKDFDWPVCIAGNNHTSDAAILDSTKNVFLLGQLSAVELKYFMERASIFAMPAKYKPFGLELLEAAKSNCALVVAKIPSLQEIWGDAALYFNPEDQEDVKSKIQLLIKDKELRKKMANKAYEKAQQFTAEKMADKYYQLNESLYVSANQNIKNLTSNRCS